MSYYDYCMGGKGHEYLFTQTSLNVINRINIGGNFYMPSLCGLGNLAFSFLLGKGEWIKCMLEEDYLIAVSFNEVEGSGYTSVQALHRTLKDGKILDVYEDDKDDGFSCFNKALFIKIARILIFLKLTKPELRIINAKTKIGTKKEGVYNSTDTNITIVDSTWNKFIVRTEGFGVQGHFRLQRHGEKNQELKLIWIQPFQKHGYIRKPKSQSRLLESTEDSSAA